MTGLKWFACVCVALASLPAIAHAEGPDRLLVYRSVLAAVYVRHPVCGSDGRTLELDVDFHSVRVASDTRKIAPMVSGAATYMRYWWTRPACVRDARVDVTVSVLGDQVGTAQYRLGSDEHEIETLSLDVKPPGQEPNALAETIALHFRGRFGRAERYRIDRALTAFTAAFEQSDAPAHFRSFLLGKLSVLGDDPEAASEYFRAASASGSAAATAYLMAEVGLADAMNQILSDLDRGKTELTAEHRQIFDRHRELLTLALEQDVGEAVALAEVFGQFGVSFDGSEIALTDRPLPTRWVVERQTNIWYGRVMEAGTALARLDALAPAIPFVADARCDGVWCYAMQGLVQWRFHVTGTPRCEDVGTDKMRCAFRTRIIYRINVDKPQGAIAEVWNLFSRGDSEVLSATAIFTDTGVWTLSPGTLEIRSSR